MKIEQKKLPKSQIEISFELTPEEFQVYIDKALNHLKKHIKIDGFRPGQAPVSMVEDKVKPEALLMDAGDAAVETTYVNYMKTQKLEPVGNPEISITKIAKGNPLLFKAVVTVLPDLILPEYKEIVKSVKAKAVEATQEEVTHSLNHLQKSRAKMTLKNEGAEKGDFVEITYQNKEVNMGEPIADQFILGEGQLIPGFEENIIGLKAGESKEFTATFPKHSPQKNLAGKEGQFTIVVKSVQKMELPEINSDFAKQLGNFETVDILKENIKEGIVIEKEEAEKQRVRAEMLDKVAQKTSFDIPESVVEYEKQRLLDDLKQRISESLKVSFEDYLASIKKTEAEIKETYQKEAEKRLKGFLLLRQIGKSENIEITPGEIDEESKKALMQYPEDQVSKIDITQFKEYTKGVIFNEKVFQKLEGYSGEITK